MKQYTARELYEAYGNLIYQRSRNLLKNHEQAQDALQECMLKLIDHYPRFDSPDHVVPWILRVVKNHCLNELKKRSKFVDNGVLDFIPIDESQLKELESSQMMQLVLESQSEDVRDAVYFTYIEELSQEEIRTVTGQSPATIRRNLAKFRETLPKIRKRLGL